MCQWWHIRAWPCCIYTSIRLYNACLLKLCLFSQYIPPEIHWVTQSYDTASLQALLTYVGCVFPTVSCGVQCRVNLNDVTELLIATTITRLNIHTNKLILGRNATQSTLPLNRSKLHQVFMWHLQVIFIHTYTWRKWSKRQFNFSHGINDIDGAPRDSVAQGAAWVKGPLSFHILKFVLNSFRLVSILLKEGSFLGPRYEIQE